jgi:DNA invertase Pin-like site-specific DNA recombinase
MTTRAAIYTRLSQDRDGSKEGTERQEKDCRALCEREGLEVVRVFTDRDTSAYNGKRRPDFEVMLSELESFDAVVFWKLDRFTRKLSEFQKVLEACDAHGVRLVSVTDGIDTSSAMGPMVKGLASLFASIGEQESHNTGTRIRRADAASAEKGRKHGGQRSFGFMRNGTELIPEEAEIGREIFERVMGAESLRQVAFDLNERGIRRPKTRKEEEAGTAGKLWTQSAISAWLKSGQVAGIRVHLGTEYPDSWQGIITLEERAALLRELERRGNAGGRVAKPKQLASGFAFCGRCGGRLVVTRQRYSCDKHPGYKNCNGVSADAEKVDAVVTEAFLSTLPRTRLAALPGEEQTEALRCAVSEHEQALDALYTDRYSVGSTMGEDIYRKLLAERQNALEDATAQLQAIERQTEALREALPPADEEALRAWWSEASFDDRRVALRKAINEVRILPQKAKGGNRFEPERVLVLFNWTLYLDIADQFNETATPEEQAQALAEYNAMQREEEEWELERALADQSDMSDAEIRKVLEQHNIF